MQHGNSRARPSLARPTPATTTTNSKRHQASANLQDATSRMLDRCHMNQIEAAQVALAAARSHFNSLRKSQVTNSQDANNNQSRKGRQASATSHRKSLESDDTHSSGFGSSASADNSTSGSCKSRTSCIEPTSGHNKSTSRLMDDLDRLIHLASGDSTQFRLPEAASPTDSSSPSEKGRPSSRAAYDYSTLCRDEFSSFIPVSQAVESFSKEPPNSPNSLESSSFCGPSIVGVEETPEATPVSCRHSNGDNNFPSPPAGVSSHLLSSSSCSPQSSRTSSPSSPIAHYDRCDSSAGSVASPVNRLVTRHHDELRARTEATGASWNANWTSHQVESQSDANEQSTSEDIYPHEAHWSVVSGQRSGLALMLDPSRSASPHIGPSLDLYLAKVEALLRLVSVEQQSHGGGRSGAGVALSKQTVCMDQLLGSVIEMSPENVTKINYLPLETQSSASARVLQEIELFESSLDRRSPQPQGAKYTESRLFDGCSLGMASSLENQLLPVDFDWTIGEPNSRASEPVEVERLASYKVPLDEMSIDELELGRNLIESLLMPSDGVECLVPEDQAEAQRLIANIKGHISEHVRSYRAHWRKLRLHLQATGDWHDNWSFRQQEEQEKEEEEEEEEAVKNVHRQFSKRPSSESNNSHSTSADHKRLRMMVHQQDLEGIHQTKNLDQSNRKPFDLKRYSTLLLSRPIKRFAYSSTVGLSVLTTDCSQYQEQYELAPSFYSSRPTHQEEVSRGALNSLNQVDACEMLVEEEEPHLEGRGRCRRRLTVSYATSTHSRPGAEGVFAFEAHGYWFRLSLGRGRLVERDSLRQRLRQRVLAKFRHLILMDSNKSCHQMEDRAHEQQRVRFLTNKSSSSVELSTNLPLVQFCFTFTGALPIRVRWFRGHQEISNDEYSNKNSVCISDRMKQPRDECDSSEWLLEMAASFDYERPTSWASRYRFRRDRQLIIFEIRRPDEQFDLNQTYRCQIENWCSVDQCEFSLTRRQVPKLNISKQRNGSNWEPKKESSRRFKEQDARDESVLALTNGKQAALLRTWSQRTLHRPVPSTDEPPAHDDQGSLEVSPGSTCLSARQQSQSVGRMSACQRSDLFGPDFPYHPENLRRRLEEGTFKTLARSRLAGQSATIQVAKSQADTDLELSSGLAAGVSQLHADEPLLMGRFHDRSVASPQLDGPPIDWRPVERPRPAPRSGHHNGRTVLKECQKSNDLNSRSAKEVESPVPEPEGSHKEPRETKRRDYEANCNEKATSHVSSSTGMSSKDDCENQASRVKSLISRFSSNR